MKKIAADRNYRNYRMLKRAQKRYSIDDFAVSEDYGVNGRSWKTNSAIVTVAQNPGMLDENDENFYYKQTLTEEQRNRLSQRTGKVTEHIMRRRGDATFVTQDGEIIKGRPFGMSRDNNAALVFWSSSPDEGWVE
jgi:hypothetical protein